MLGHVVPNWLTIVIAATYGLSLPFAGWLVIEAGRVRREERRRPPVAVAL
jgi:hypothetical protein